MDVYRKAVEKIGEAQPLKMIMEVQKNESKFEYAIAALSNLRPKTLRIKNFLSQKLELYQVVKNNK